MRPELQDSALVFTILIPGGEQLTSDIYATYHGRFVEFALNHADKLFDQADVSASPEGNDEGATADDID
jgi:hypothetical protein